MYNLVRWQLTFLIHRTHPTPSSTRSAMTTPATTPPFIPPLVLEVVPSSPPSAPAVVAFLPEPELGEPVEAVTRFVAEPRDVVGTALAKSESLDRRSTATGNPVYQLRILCA